MKTMKQMCEVLAEGALANYGKDGHLAPVMIFLDRDQHDVCRIIPEVEARTGGMPGAVFAIGNVMVPLFDAHYLALISETWVTVQSIADPNVPKRGELEERAHGGDQTVETGILVTAWDLDHLERSHQISYWVDQNFARHDSPGLGIGELADAVREMAKLSMGMQAGRPSGPVPVMLVQAATDALREYISVVMADPAAVTD